MLIKKIEQITNYCEKIMPICNECLANLENDRMTLSVKTSRLRSLLAVLLAASALAGCAVQSNGRGGVIIGVDNAQLFGTTVGTFRLHNGTEGSLRRDPTNNKFSVKLDGSLRVVVLQTALSARIARVQVMGTRTVVVIETEERNCPFKYEVLSIEGSDVLKWQIGNCRERPRVALAEGGTALYFDFPANGRLQRNIYLDGRMLNAGAFTAPGIDLATRPFADATLHAPQGAAAPLYQRQTQPPGQTRHGSPADAMANAPAGASRVIPLPPHKAGSIPAPAARVAVAKAPVRAATPPRVAAERRGSGNADLPQAMNMGDEEVKVIRLDLR
jgi:hypothetical protein